MNERPILFKAPMVRAILADIKTQTRRTYKTRKHPDIGCDMAAPELAREALHVIYRACPYGQPGDRLWVRETWRVGAWRAESQSRFAIDYAASPEITNTPWLNIPDDPHQQLAINLLDQIWAELRAKDIAPDYRNWTPGKSPLKWHPSIFMPRWACRFLLEIVSVRLEQLNTISPTDAIAEGLTSLSKDDGRTFKYGIPDFDGWPGTDDIGWAWQSWNSDPRVAYRTLWERINGRNSWDANPWVWVIEYKRVSP